MTECDQQVAAQMQHLQNRTLHTHTRAHTQWPRMHIESTDPLGRPEQWCFKSSVTLGSPQSHNCSDRIGPEMRVGLKIDLLFLKTPCSFNAECKTSCKILDKCLTDSFFPSKIFHSYPRTSSQINSEENRRLPYGLQSVVRGFLLQQWTQSPPTDGAKAGTINRLKANHQ